MKTCLLCNSPIRDEMSLTDIVRLTPLPNPSVCSDCNSEFSDLSALPTCDGCGRRQTAGMPSPCNDCLRWEDPDSMRFMNTALFEYNSFMKDYMKKYKFNGDYRLRKVFSQRVRDRLHKTNAVIVPIPVSTDTMANRGFNQVTGLLEYVKFSEVLKVKLKRKTVRQSAKNRRDRLELIQPFEMIQSKKFLTKNKAILLVDDVYTTGTTIRHAANLLYQSGATSVRGLTLAR